MKVRKHTYTDKSGGEKRETAKFYAVFSDHHMTLRRLPLFKDKKASQQAANAIEKLVSHRAAGNTMPPELTAFVENTLPAIRTTLAKWDILDPRRIQASKPLKEHLAAWEGALKAKGSTDGHVRQTLQRVRKVIDGCGFRFMSEISVGRVRTALARLQEGEKGFNSQTIKFYRSACRQFCNWAVREHRVAENPLLHLETPKTVSDRRHPRRAFTLVELQALIDTARRGPDRMGMSGPERALLYRLAVETAFRANELRSLTRASFKLNGDEPTVTIAAAYSKRRREDSKLLSAATADVMRTHLACKAGDAKAFNMPGRTDVSRMFKPDLKAAGVEYRNASGEYADFHSLRHTSGTFLKDAGVHAKLIQQHMRHSTITLTMDRYTHTHRTDEAIAVGAMPALNWPAAKAASGDTGLDTAKENTLSPSLSPRGGADETLVDLGGQMYPDVPIGDPASKSAEAAGKTGTLTQIEVPGTLLDALGRSARAVYWAGLENR
jgi:integrase/recombinase XerD